jgi:hypothetical protein
MEEKQEEVRPPKQNPHQGEITVNAIVYKQLSNGTFSPEAVWHDSFAIRFVSDTPDKCIEELKTMLMGIKGIQEKQ